MNQRPAAAFTGARSQTIELNIGSDIEIDAA